MNGEQTKPVENAQRRLKLQHGLLVAIKGRFMNSSAPQPEVVRLETVRTLLDAGADANFRSGNLTHPLIMAVVEWQFTVARLLIERGADVNAKDSHGNSVLICLTRVIISMLQAAKAGVDDAIYFVLELIVKHGVDTNVVNDMGHSALSIAVFASKDARLVEALCARQGSKNIGDFSMSLVIEARSAGRNLMKIANERKDPEGPAVVAALLSSGADVYFPHGFML